MKKILGVLAFIGLIAAIAYAATPTCTGPQSGYVVGTQAQADAASASTGAGDLYVADEFKVSGTSAFTGTATSTGKRVTTPSTVVTLSTGTTITLSAAFALIASSGGAVTNVLPGTTVATAIISTSTVVNPNGTKVILMGTSDTDIITLSDSPVFALGGATRALGVGDILELIIYNGIWYEVGFTNN
jgi:hypothetical protein